MSDGVPGMAPSAPSLPLVYSCAMAMAMALYKRSATTMLSLRHGLEPCGECHLQQGEVCVICGAKDAI